MNNHLRNILITIFASFILFSCSNNNQNAINELSLSVGPEPMTLDPAINSSIDASIYIVHVFEGLTIRGEDQRARPGAASSWEVSDDNMSYTFHIRTNAFWSDGVPVRAGDFVYAFRRVVDPKTSSYHASSLDVVKNAKAIIDGKISPNELGVYAIDDKTLRIDLDSPVTYLDEILTSTAFSPLREDIVSTNEDAWTLNNYIGNGAYKLGEWRHDDRIILERNTNYWDNENVLADRLVFSLISDDNTAIAGIYSEGILFYKDTPPNERDNVVEAGFAKNIPDVSLYAYLFNNTKAPYNDKRVRRALSLAIDREYIVENVMRGGEPPANGVVPFGIMEGTTEFRKDARDYFSTKSEDYQKNVEEARRLLSEAGFPNGKGFPIVEFKSNPSQTHMLIAEAVQRMWKESLNIEMRINNEEWSVFQKSQKDRDYDVARVGWVCTYNNPMSMLKNFKSQNPGNYTGYNNQNFDNMLNLSLSSRNESERKNALLEAEEMIIDDMAVAPIYYYTITVMQNPNLRGVLYDIFNIHRFHRARYVNTQMELAKDK